MHAKKTVSACLATAAAILSWALLGPSVVASDDDAARIKFVDDEIVFEFVRQVTNFAATPSAPLGTSKQYGYLTAVRGTAFTSVKSPT